MKYQNARDVLPDELLTSVQEYFQGGYLYVPQKVRNRPEQFRTAYKMELIKRDTHIFLKHLDGWSNSQLGKFYHLSDSIIRRILLREKRKAEKMNTEWEKILSAWGMEPADVEQKYPTVWEINHQYMLKEYETPKSLGRNIQSLTALSECGAPVAGIIKTLNGENHTETDGKYWLMTAKLPGSRRTDIREPGTAYKMGETIARLHVFFRECEQKITFWDNSLLDEMEGWIKQALQENAWEPVSEQEYLSVTAQLRSVYDSLPKQLIHRDVHFGNFLFLDGEFSGYIDFDLSQRNIRIFDLGYFLAGLLTRESGAKLEEDEWLRIVCDVISGYESVSKLKREEKAALVPVMESIEILFAAYFIRTEDRICAEDAADIFHKIRDREERIRGFSF